MAIIRKTEDIFSKMHVERCEQALAGTIPISDAVTALRQSLAEESSDDAAKLLKRAASRERRPFKAKAIEAIDRILKPDEDGTPASQLETNKALIDFISLVTPNIRLRARAGSGKSTAIIIKCSFLIETLGVNPESIQILTFNRKAAENLGSDLRKALGDDVGGRIECCTFHSLAVNVLRRFPETSRTTLVFNDEERSLKEQTSDLEKTVLSETVPNDFRAYRERYKGTKHEYKIKAPDFEVWVRKYVTGATALLRARRGTPGQIKRNPVTMHLSRIVESYEKRMQDTGVLDGEAGLRRAAEVLKSGAEIPKSSAEIQRFIGLTGGLKYLFVDEYQDFSAAFNALTQGIIARNPSCVLNTVGDDWQSINAFMGADLSFFNGFKKNYPAALHLPLQTNWRCGKRIVELGNHVMNADQSVAAVAGLPHEGKIRVKTGGIKISPYRRKEGEETARNFLTVQLQKMANFAWADDLRAGKKQGSLVLLAFSNNPYGLSLEGYAKAIEPPEGIKVQFSTSHGSKGIDWDHVILLDGCASNYPSEHPADPIKRDMIDYREKEAEGGRLLYVAVTRAKRSLTILAPTELHPRLVEARKLAMA